MGIDEFLGEWFWFLVAFTTTPEKADTIY